MTSRRTAREKLPNEPRRLKAPFEDQPLPLDGVAEIVRKTREEQGLPGKSERRWR